MSNQVQNTASRTRSYFGGDYTSQTSALLIPLAALLGFGVHYSQSMPLFGVFDPQSLQPGAQGALPGIILFFCLCWVLEAGLRLTLNRALATGNLPKQVAGILEDPRNAGVIARLSMSTILMAWFGYEGVRIALEMGPVTMGGEYMKEGAVVAYGAERVYLFNAGSQRLSMIQTAFQLKNLVDTISHSDGIVFVLHHIATASLAVSGLYPYLHIYAPFFFGISELSTAVLCLLAMFGDESKPEMGVPALGELFPATKDAVGTVFAILFIVFRVLLWPWVSYHFWLDSLAVLGQPEHLHSAAVVYGFLGANIFLTILQLVWLSEIVAAAQKMMKQKAA